MTSCVQVAHREGLGRAAALHGHHLDLHRGVRDGAPSRAAAGVVQVLRHAPESYVRLLTWLRLSLFLGLESCQEISSTAFIKNRLLARCATWRTERIRAEYSAGQALESCCTIGPAQDICKEPVMFHCYAARAIVACTTHQAIFADAHRVFMTYLGVSRRARKTALTCEPRVDSAATECAGPSRW